MIGLVLALALALASCGGDGRGGAEKTPEGAGADTVSAGYRAVTVEHGGSITGRVTLDGAIPRLADFTIGDAAACSQAAKNNRAEIGPGKGIGSAVVYLEGVNEGKGMPPLSADQLTIDQRGCQYLPHLLAAPVGSTVTFVNSDEIAHNVRVQDAATDSMMLNRAQPVRGRRDSMLVAKTGPASVGCDYHPWMNAYVFGVDNPYYAVTGPDGAFAIGDIPPGTYKLKLWLNGVAAEARTDNNGRIIRYAFGEPYVREKMVEIGKDQKIEVAFGIAIAMPDKQEKRR